MRGSRRWLFLIISLSAGVFALSAAGEDACNRETPCTPDTVLPDPEDCEKYYECNDGGQWKRQPCRQGEFDSEQNSCVPSGTATCFSCDPSCIQQVPCQVGDQLGDPTNCNGFYECTAVFVWTQAQCPTGQTFDTNSRQCLRIGVGGIECQPPCPGWPETDLTTEEMSDTTSQKSGSTEGQSPTTEPAEVSTKLSREATIAPIETMTTAADTTAAATTTTTTTTTTTPTTTAAASTADTTIITEAAVTMSTTSPPATTSSLTIDDDTSTRAETPSATTSPSLTSPAIGESSSTTEDTTPTTLFDDTTATTTITTTELPTTYFEDQRYCGEDISGGLEWNETEVGRAGRQACPGTLAGEAERVCSEDVSGEPVWEPVYLGLCELLDQVTTLQSIAEENLTAESVEAVAQILETVVARGTTMGMSPKYLNATVESLEFLVYINPEVSKNFINVTAGMIGSILSPYNQEAWTSLINMNGSQAINLLNVVEEVANDAAELIGEGERWFFSTQSFVLDIVSVIKNESFRDLVFDDLPQSTDYITLPGQTLQQLNTAVAENDIVVWSTQYSQLGHYLPIGDGEEIASNILGMTITNLTEGMILYPPIQMRFALTTTSSLEDKDVRCVFWHYNRSTMNHWDDEGCNVISRSERNISCECNHLTNFAVLISPYLGENTIHHKILDIIGVIGCLLSIIGCLLTLCLYAIAWKHVSSQHAIVMLNLCLVLILANTLFLGGIEKTDHKLACMIIAAALHYLYLVAMMLMLADGLYFILYVVYVFHTKETRETLLILLTSWMLPGVILGLSLGITKLEGYGTPRYCWLARENWVILAFIVPVLIIIVINFFIFVKVLRTAATSKSTEHKNRLLSTLWNVMVILPLLGITWVFGLLSVNEDTLPFQYVFSICNSLQGFFILVCHCILNKKLRDGVIAKFKSPSSSNVSLKSGKSNRSNKSTKSGNSNKSTRKLSEEERLTENASFKSANSNNSSNSSRSGQSTKSCRKLINEKRLTEKPTEMKETTGYMGDSDKAMNAPVLAGSDEHL